MNFDFRTGRIEWGRAPSAIVYFDVVYEDGRRSLLMVLPSGYNHHKPLPKDFKYISHDQFELQIPESVLKNFEVPAQCDKVLYEVYHLLEDERRSNNSKHISVETNFRYFGLGHGWCYLCFPPVNYVPVETWDRQQQVVWVWSDRFLAVGEDAPCVPVRCAFDHYPHLYQVIRRRYSSDVWATELSPDLQQRFLHVAICQIVAKYRDLNGGMTRETN